MKKVFLTLLMSSSLAVFSQTVKSTETYKITNGSGFILATLTVTDNNEQVLKNTKGVYLGKYVAETGITYDSTDTVFGNGNLISILICNKENSN